MWSWIQTSLAASALLISLGMTTVLADEAPDIEIAAENHQPPHSPHDDKSSEQPGKNYRLADYHYFLNTSDHIITFYVGDFIPETVTLYPGQGRYIYMSTRHQTIEIGHAW
ncbi:hypothetical protein ElyMa_000522200 [Elysia marginata]|uniref:Uncharacterized protein n=1 Tax=Elysia marginata TaxID=1093978 RepID=A0AAV4G0C7_9GAST|nr:hypothetical protein ElyMa_000522200 [Elysia marginata]